MSKKHWNIQNEKKANKAYKKLGHISKKQAKKIEEFTWVEVKWRDCSNQAVLVTGIDDSSVPVTEREFLIDVPGDYNYVSYEQIVRVIGPCLIPSIKQN